MLVTQTTGMIGLEIGQGPKVSGNAIRVPAEALGKSNPDPSIRTISLANHPNRTSVCV